MKLEIRPCYEIRELSLALGWTHDRLYRRLRRKGLVEGQGHGVKLDVPLVAFREAFPDLWESLLLAQRLAA
jgi:hypothetical protein